eukprot:6195530-Pleurochrysis_carterae.AAC.1
MRGAAHADGGYDRGVGCGRLPPKRYAVCCSRARVYMWLRANSIKAQTQKPIGCFRLIVLSSLSSKAASFTGGVY